MSLEIVTSPAVGLDFGTVVVEKFMAKVDRILPGVSEPDQGSLTGIPDRFKSDEHCQPQITYLARTSAKHANCNPQHYPIGTNMEEFEQPRDFVSEWVHIAHADHSRGACANGARLTIDHRILPHLENPQLLELVIPDTPQPEQTGPTTNSACKRYHVHRGLLASTSVEWEKHINNNMMEGRNASITLHELDHPTVAFFLEWMYSGNYLPQPSQK